MDFADIRETIYQHLCINIPAVSNRVKWGWTASAETEKPFLEIIFSGMLPSINSPLGAFMQIDILVVGERKDILSLDPIVDSVISALHNVDIATVASPPRLIRLEFKRDSRIDYWSEDLQGNLIRLKFWLPTDFWT